MRLTFIAICFVLGANITGCSSPVDYSELVTVQLNQDMVNGEAPAQGTKLPMIEFHITRGYLEEGAVSSHDVSLHFLYPEVMPFSRKRLHLFYKESGARTAQVVRVHLNYFADTRLGNANDGGRFWFTRHLNEQPSQYVRLQEPENLIDRIPDIAVYTAATDQSDIRYFVFKQEGDRIVVVECTAPYFCNGYTTWNSLFSVEFVFSRTLFLDQMAEIESAVQELISSFEPHQIRMP